VFPFGFQADQETIDRAAHELMELNSASVSRVIDLVGNTKQAYSRANYVTIREGDKSRLKNGVYLNDNLIDFWMQWYVAPPPERMLN
jgi:Ulp1 family protease